jgi:hypothetical protein
MRVMRFLCVTAAIALSGVATAGASPLAAGGQADACFAAAAPRAVHARLGVRVAAQKSKTCYACGLCTTESCCGSNGWFLEDCTKPDGTAGKKCCKWD